MTKSDGQKQVELLEQIKRLLVLNLNIRVSRESALLKVSVSMRQSLVGFYLRRTRKSKLA